MKKLVLAVSVFLALLVICAVAVPFQSVADSNVLAPRIKVKEGTSTNWSGYAVPATVSKKGQANAVTDVQGWWTVPTASADPLNGNSLNTYSANWVGIDGYNSSSVEQLGSESDWYNGVPRYYVWWEIYPKPSYLINQTVHARDNMFAEVKYSNGVFALTLSDYGLTTGAKPLWTFTTSQKSGKANLSSAEWVVEAPWSGGVLPLTSFGTTYFSNSKATIGGTTGPIGAWTNYDRMDMVVSNSPPYVLKDQTSPLGADKASFNVQWLRSK